jgi:segregation and condensation protein A
MTPGATRQETVGIVIEGGTRTGARPAVSGRAQLTLLAEARPEQAAQVQVEGFEGPLAVLLALIEQRQLDVLTVPLGELAGAYLDQLARLPSVRMAHISAFVSVAAQLILIKSRAMLPRPPAASAPGADGPDPEVELRERLIEYRRFRDAARRLSDRLSGAGALFHREAAAAVAAAQAGARPDGSPPLDPQLLRAALETALRYVPPPPPTPAVMGRSVTLEERAAVIRSALRAAPQVVLQDLLVQVSDRVVVAVTFLAMLELVKGRELTIEQAAPWGPIVCRALTAEGAPVTGIAIDGGGPFR